MKALYTILSCILFVLIHSCAKEKGALSGTVDVCDTVLYAADIRPIVDAKCMSCHGVSPYSGGDFTTYQGLKTAADNGQLYKAVVTDKTMPIDNTLSATEIKKFRCWIESGAANN